MKLHTLLLVIAISLSVSLGASAQCCPADYMQYYDFNNEQHGNIDDYTLLALRPVELSYFDAFHAGDGVMVEWETASEINSRGFEIQRREALPNIETWDVVAFIDGAEVSTEPIQYDYLDQSATRGVLYEYRLRMIDFDGSHEFSNHVAVQFGAVSVRNVNVAEFHFESSPNPVAASAQISFILERADPLHVSIHNSLGVPVRTLLNNANGQPRAYTLEWDGADGAGRRVPAGMYFVRLAIGSDVAWHKLAVVR